MNEELYHYGVKGMKWGVRKDRGKKTANSVSSSTARRVPPRRDISKMSEAEINALTKRLETENRYRQAESYNNDLKGYSMRGSENIKNLMNRDISTLSNDELRLVVDRMDLERRYSMYRPTQVSTGRKIADTAYNVAIKDILAPAAKEVAKDTIKSVGKGLVNSYTKNKFGIKVFKDDGLKSKKGVNLNDIVGKSVEEMTMDELEAVSKRMEAEAKVRKTDWDSYAETHRKH